MIPVGGEDLDTMSGDLCLGMARGNEPFLRIGGSENEPPGAGEVVYKDDAGVVCRRWNWREAERTKLTENTKNAIIVVDGLTEIGKDTVRAATEEMASLVSGHCGATARVYILDQEKRQIVLR